ncbi:hypothetical protein D3C87_1343860 [compost metagenome]
MVQHRRAGAQLRLPRRGVGIAAKVIVEAPAADELAHLQHFRRTAQAADLIEQAVECRRVLRQYIPLAIGAGTDHRAVTIDQQTGRAIERPGPQAFAFDLRVEAEIRRYWRAASGQHEMAIGIG